MSCQTSTCERKVARTSALRPSLLFGIPPPSPLPPELSEVGRAKTQYPLHIPTAAQPARFDLGFVKVTCFSNLFSVLNPHVGIKQLTQGVRCAHIYLLSTLEDFVLSSLLLPQISLKNKPITNFRGYCTIPAPKRLVVPDRLLLRACVYLFKVNGFCVSFSFYGRRENREYYAKIYSFL